MVIGCSCAYRGLHSHSVQSSRYLSVRTAPEWLMDVINYFHLQFKSQERLSLPW